MSKLVEFDWIKRNDGTSEFEDFLNALPEKDCAKLLATIENVETEGIAVAIKMKWVRKLEKDLFEIRSKQGSDIQRALYFHNIGKEYMITHGFSKKTDKTPKQEINHAKMMMKKYGEIR